MIKFIIHIFCYLSFFSFSQENITKVAEHSVNPKSVWHADLLGNLYIADKDLLIKYDTANVKQYSQSIKSIGRVTSISSVNTMRIVLFSEDQQTFSILDNTLSEANHTYDLSELGFGFVTSIAVSGQANKFWIYDQSESKLVLLDLGRTNQQQEISNLRGMLNIDNISWIKEENNNLFLLNEEKGIFVFDLYGTLINHIKLPKLDDADLSNGSLFTLKNGTVSRYIDEDHTFEKVNLPISNISEFQWVNDTFFVRSGNILSKYRFYL